MEINRLLSNHSECTDEDILGMIISNRIDFYAGDTIGACVSIKNWKILIEDIIKWRDFRNSSNDKKNKEKD